MLLDAGGNARLGDAGLAVEMAVDRSCVTGTNRYVGTQPFMDPFAKENERKTCNDMFSVGVGEYCLKYIICCKCYMITDILRKSVLNMAGNESCFFIQYNQL